jgi:peptidoglycan/LPS O-acetylase OafA/YrhL
MIGLIPVIFVLVMAYAQYKQGKRNSQWSWFGFFGVLGAMGLFLVCFIIPVVQSKTLEAHPGRMMTALLGGILVFTSALIYAARRISMKLMVKPPAVEASKSGKALALALLAICVFSCAQHGQAQGKEVYKDPTGTYSVAVPSVWEAKPQQGSPMVSIVNAKAKVSVTPGRARYVSSEQIQSLRLPRCASVAQNDGVVRELE